MQTIDVSDRAERMAAVLVVKVVVVVEVEG